MWGPGRPAVSAVAAAVAARAEDLVKRCGRVAGILPGGVEAVTAASAAAAQAQQLNRAPIEVTGLCKRFGSAVALDGIPFTVLPGQVTGFVGLPVRHSASDLAVPRVGDACRGCPPASDGERRLPSVTTPRPPLLNVPGMEATIEVSGLRQHAGLDRGFDPPILPQYHLRSPHDAA